jgi:hypothetical protein
MKRLRPCRKFSIRTYFFIVPPGVVASPFFCAEPAVLAPWVLASLDDGIALCAAGPVVPFFMAPPLFDVVPLFMDSPVVVLLPAGPPAWEDPPAVLLCAIATDAARESAEANKIVFLMVVSSC